MLAGAPAGAEPVFLWDEPLDDTVLNLTVSEPFIAARTDRQVHLFTWDGTRFDAPLQVPFVGEHEGVFRMDTVDGLFHVRLDLRQQTLDIADGEESEFLTLDLRNRRGNFNRAAPGPAGRTVLLYRQGRTGGQQQASVFEWIKRDGTTIWRYLHDRSVQEPSVFFSAGEKYVAVVDEDRLLVFGEQGLIRDIQRTEGESGYANAKVVVGEQKQFVLVVREGEGAFAQAWSLDARPLFRVNLPGAMTWEYTEGSPVAVGVPREGGVPRWLNVLTGAVHPVPGWTARVQAAVGDAEGKRLGVVSPGRFSVWLAAP